MGEIKLIGLVVYDGNCGVCKAIVTKFQSPLGAIGLEVAPFQSDLVAEQLGVDSEQSPEDIILLLNDDQKIYGANAYRYIFRHFWLSYPLYLLSIIPGCNLIFDWSYRKFADNRHRISGSCGLTAEDILNANEFRKD